MKFIIAHSETKREILGPFNICGSRDDFRWLEEQLKKHRKLKEKSFYSWISIIERPKEQKTIENTPPRGWDE